MAYVVAFYAICFLRLSQQELAETAGRKLPRWHWKDLNPSSNPITQWLCL